MYRFKKFIAVALLICMIFTLAAGAVAFAAEDDYDDYEDTDTVDICEAYIDGPNEKGDLVIDISRDTLSDVYGIDENDLISIRVGKRSYVLPVEPKDEELATFWGRARFTNTKYYGRMKIVRQDQDFCQMEGYGKEIAGEIATIRLLEKDGYKMERHIDGNASPEVVANFRCSVAGNMKDGVIYRGHSPIDPKLKKKSCSQADYMSEKVGIKTMINLNQDYDAAVMAVEKKAQDSYYSKVLTDGGVSGGEIDGAKSFDKSFKNGLRDHFRFMLSHEGPYYIHCRMGKDRTGFMCAVLEALAGASYSEIADDYAKSYNNYFDTKKWTWMDVYNRQDGANAFFGMMDPGAGTTKYLDDNGTLAQRAAVKYLRSIGLSTDEINALKAIIIEDNIDNSAANIINNSEALNSIGQESSDNKASQVNLDGVGRFVE